MVAIVGMALLPMVMFSYRALKTGVDRVMHQGKADRQKKTAYGGLRRLPTSGNVVNISTQMPPLSDACLC